MRQMKIKQHEIGIIFLNCGNGAVRIFGCCDNPVARIVLDQILERGCELRVVFDN